LAPGRGRPPARDSRSAGLPFISVIIPTYNRPALLAQCLKSITALEYPRERFEVIVVDDGSTVSPEAAFADCPADLNALLLGQHHAGPSVARNSGAARARGELLAFTDDDCQPQPDWLRALAARFSTAPDQAIGGRTFNLLTRSLYSSASQLLHDCVYAYFNAAPDDARFLAANNLALPARLFETVGGFEPSLWASEDRELCDRWRARGLPLVYAPEVVVGHAHQLSLASFWQQHYRYGRSTFAFHRLRARRRLGRFEAQPGFYWYLLTSALRSSGRGRALSMAALLGLTQAAKAAGFLAEGLRVRR
jgi:glycosyltransferase involved in cell wall biosynthesis